MTCRRGVGGGGVSGIVTIVWASYLSLSDSETFCGGGRKSYKLISSFVGLFILRMFYIPSCLFLYSKF